MLLHNSHTLALVSGFTLSGIVGVPAVYGCAPALRQGTRGLPVSARRRAAAAAAGRQAPVRAGGFGRRMSYEQLQEVGNIIVGSPQTVTRKLRQIIERLSPGYLHIYGNEGLKPHQDVMRSIELLGKEVIPALHEVRLQPYT